MENITCEKCIYYNNIKDNIGKCLINNDIVFKDTKIDCKIYPDNFDNIRQIVVGCIINKNNHIIRYELLCVIKNNNNEYAINVLNKSFYTLKETLINKFIIASINDKGICYKRTKYLNNIEFIDLMSSLKNNNIIRYNTINIDNFMYNDNYIDNNDQD